MHFLFLDRDGVINRHLLEGYVYELRDWEWQIGVKKYFPLLRKKFERIFIVSNQQGVAKQIFSVKELYQITQFYKENLQALGGKIDGFYHCLHWKMERCTCRKPETGMALQAQQDFPEVIFEDSIMVGDSISDLQMGKQLGMRTIYLNTRPVADSNKIWVDSQYANIGEWVEAEYL